MLYSLAHAAAFLPLSLAALPASGAPIKYVTAVSAGLVQTCVLISTGELKCWGRNDSGQLGIGSRETRGTSPEEMGDALPAIDLGSGLTVKKIVANRHICPILSDDSVKCWGENIVGELGLGDTLDRGTDPAQMGDALPAVNLGSGLRPIELAVGLYSTCVLFDSGAVKCWGSGSYGETGLGSSRNLGSKPGQMGDALPAVAIGTGRTATAISAGLNHTCVILDDASVKCWGANYSGQLGLGDKLSRGDKADDMGDYLPKVNLGTGRTATAIAAGSSHTCALLDDGAVKCWGNNAHGELGIGAGEARGGAPGEMGDALPAVDLGTGRHAIDVKVGQDLTCALLDDRSLKCWGSGEGGRLGLGDIEDRGLASSQMGDALPALDLGGFALRSYSVGYNFACAILNNGGLKCWGNNTYGQLGTGDTVSRGGAPGDMAALPFAHLWDAF